MLRRFVIVAALAAMPALAQTKGEIDWSRRVLVGHGQGAPDLNAPSVAVARLGAERAAKLDAYRNALEALQGMQVQSGGSVGTLMQNDSTLSSRVDGELKGVRPIKTHYYSDGGVSLDIEVPLDELPPELARAIKVPDGVAPLKGAGQAAAQGQGAAPSGDVQVQTATGQAAVLDGDKPAAREKAIQDALRHAVEMAVGTKVSSQSEVQDFQSKMDQVFTHSAGFVKRYEIVKEGMDGDVVQVTVRATISNADLDKDLEAMGMLMARKGMPRTMVLIAEQNIGMAAPSAAWMKDKGGANALVSADLRIAENTILDQLKNGGFRQLIDPEIATEKAAQVGGITTEINASQARKLKSLTGAEVIDPRAGDRDLARRDGRPRAGLAVVHGDHLRPRRQHRQRRHPLHRRDHPERRAARRPHLRQGSDQEGGQGLLGGHGQEDRRALVAGRLGRQRDPRHGPQGPLFQAGLRLA